MNHPGEESNPRRIGEFVKDLGKKTTTSHGNRKMKTVAMTNGSSQRLLVVRGLLRCVGVTLLFARVASAQPAEQATPRPNILFLLTDDQRWDTLSCAGNPHLETPHLDRLAKEGARFTQALVTVSLCCPSRATLLTGKHAHIHGVLTNEPDLDSWSQHRLFPELLQEAGYETAFFGKWHLPRDPKQPVPGFDHWVSFRGQGNYENETLDVNGKPEVARGFVSDALTKRAKAWIEQERTQPFFVMLSLKNCHAPFRPPKRHLLSLDSKIVELPGSVQPGEFLPARVRRFQSRQAESTQYQEALRAEYCRYLELVLSVDESVGTLLETLENSGLTQNTAVIFTSDNGYLWGEHGVYYKSLTYEPSLRVPLLIRAPGDVPPNRRIDGTVLNLDLAPTLLELAGVPIPEDMQGTSLTPLWRTSDQEWRPETFHHAPFRGSGGTIPKDLSLRRSDFKYILMRTDNRVDELLFHLAADPAELRNLSADKTYEATLQEFREGLRNTLTTIEAPVAWASVIPN